jgi:translation elongation factor EF-1alpha
MATFLIQDVYNITGIGAVPVGRVESGILRIGMKANVDGNVIEIKTIEKHHVQIKEAQTGDNIGISVTVINQGSSVNQNTSFLKKLFGSSNSGYNLLKKYVRRSIEFI